MVGPVMLKSFGPLNDHMDPRGPKYNIFSGEMIVGIKFRGTVRDNVGHMEEAIKCCKEDGPV